MSVISVSDLTAGYGGLPVVRNLDLRVDAGEVVALLGPNGAGKTTTLLTIGGVLPAIRGSIEVAGASTIGVPIHRIARRGLALLPADRGIIFQLTVGENLRLHRRGKARSGDDAALDYFPQLAGLMNRRAGLLSGGEQQMLALACKLTSQPIALMVDELSMGLAPIVVERLLARWFAVSRPRPVSRCCSSSSTSQLHFGCASGGMCSATANSLLKEPRTSSPTTASS